MTAASDYVTDPAALRVLLGKLDDAELVLLATQALRVGSLDYAAAICEVREDPAPALRLAHAAALFGTGQQQSAIALVDGVLAEIPDHLSALFYRAQMAQHGGDLAQAARLLLEVLTRFPDYPGAQGALASVRLPGPTYRDVLRRIHELLRPRTYLEIGVETGATLALSSGCEHAIGIDPDASKLRPELVHARARVFHETSDAFFTGRKRALTLGDRRVDLAFIDGMHWFEYALRDFMHVEAWSAPDGTVIFHDCLPVFPLTATRERRSKFWVGDVWKLVPILRELRPELRLKIIATAPSGLCVVRGLDPGSRVLADAYEEIVRRYQDEPYPAAALDVPAGFDLVPATENGLRAALA